MAHGRRYVAAAAVAATTAAVVLYKFKRTYAPEDGENSERKRETN